MRDWCSWFLRCIYGSAPEIEVEAPRADGVVGPDTAPPVADPFDDWVYGQTHDINPATGLPMIGGLDVAGNPYEVDLDDNWHRDTWHDHGLHGDDWSRD